MQEYDTTVTIDTPPDKVWAILTEGSAYQQWNPEIVAIDGPIAAAHASPLTHGSATAPSGGCRSA